MKLINLYTSNTRNIGDLVCSPVLYFRELRRTQIIDINHLDKIRDLDAADYIVGGGGLISNDWMGKEMERLFADGRRKIVVWGAGINAHGAESMTYPPYLFRAGLVGLRDIGDGHEWVPCTSCLSPVFDKPRQPEHEFVVYDHWQYRFPVEGFPRMDNFKRSIFTRFKSIVDFLASGETILTTSYHGMYWGALLGRRVVAIPFSNKFHAFKYPVPLCTASDWREALPRAQVFPEALAECRNANLVFAKKVFRYLEIK